MKVTNKFKGFAVLTTLCAGFSMFALNASAVTYEWRPLSTIEAVSVVGTAVTFTDNVGNHVSCTSVSGTNAEAPAAGSNSKAQTVNGSGAATPPSFSGCSSNLGSASVSCSTAWIITATSTTTADVGNVVCTITITPFIGSCTITVGTTQNPVSVTGNSWSNPNSQLTANSSVNFSISESGTACDGATTAHESGTVQVGATKGGVTIVQV